ncbi:unnamed protein product [Tetraodon nigroviridis]|uniref:Protein DIS3 homolog n=1 Tax=Tetraodon nigroviridis TaxID=99883 RepID=Q4RNE5_TETNG|nr:unnamed protein product [Tetraodon nigroviridis]
MAHTHRRLFIRSARSPSVLQVDVLEDPVIRNVVILQTVLQEVRHRSAPVYKRVKDMIHDKEKHFYTFTNEHHRETFIEREPGESANDRNDRAIRVASRWYSQHLRGCQSDGDELKVVLLTNDLANKQKAEENNLLVYKCEEYIKSLTANPELVDRLALSSDDKNDITSNKVLFPEHLPLSAIQAGIKNGSFLQGTFRASRDNYLEATVFVHGEGEDGTEVCASTFIWKRALEESQPPVCHQVLIQGLQNLNRAVHQDVVALQLFPQSQWVAPSSVLLQDEGEAKDADADEEEEKVVNLSARKPTGKVVGIIKRNWRPFCGMLNVSQIKESTRHLFTPADRCIPRIRIETRQASALAGQRIMVAIDGWPKHSRYPNGHFVRSLGKAGDKDTEQEVLLLEHDVPHQPFSQAVLSFLPKMPWSITAERIDMVPELLSSNLCSLRSNVDRFAFSCIWELSHDAEILKTRFTKSVINSKVTHTHTHTHSRVGRSLKTAVEPPQASLTYAEAQMRIDDGTKNDDITQSLRGLNKLAKILKKQRIENGALTLSSLEVRFHMDSETHDPIDLQAKELLETNSMVEEFMLLANISVAQRIYREFPDCAMLRKHPAPPPSNYDILHKASRSKNVEIRTDSAKALADSLDKASVDGFLYFNTLLRILATRCMMQAVYFCSGMDSDFHHYGLASPIYTHFTSPIRRYADIVVHRLLAVACSRRQHLPRPDGQTQAVGPVQQPQLQTQDGPVCPEGLRGLPHSGSSSHWAPRLPTGLNGSFSFQLFFKSRGILNEEGFVLFVRKNAVVVLIPRFGLEGTVFFDTKDKSAPQLVFDEEVRTAGSPAPGAPGRCLKVSCARARVCVCVCV